MRYLALLITTIFFLFSLVQYNDPDPLTWIGIYGLVALASVLVFLKKIPEWALWAMLPFYLAGSIYLWPEQFEGISMPMHTKPWIEEARESLGLLIAFFSVGILIFLSRKTKFPNGTTTG